MLIFNDTEEKAVEKAIAALADMIPLEAMQPPYSPALTFPGYNTPHRHRVIKTRLTEEEYARLSPFPRSMMNYSLPLGNSQPSMGKSAAT